MDNYDPENLANTMFFHPAILAFRHRVAEDGRVIVEVSKIGRDWEPAGREDMSAVTALLQAHMEAGVLSVTATCS
jgi:hypothetical protein